MFKFILNYKTGEIVEYEISRNELIGYVEFFSKLKDVERILIEKRCNNE